MYFFTKDTKIIVANIFNYLTKCRFSGHRTLAKLDQLFGECSGSSESEVETIAEKRQISEKSIPGSKVFEQTQSSATWE